MKRSTRCIDCGYQTQPRKPKRNYEQYIVRDSIWHAAGMPPGRYVNADTLELRGGGGCLCVGCIETRLCRESPAVRLQPANHLGSAARLLQWVAIPAIIRGCFGSGQRWMPLGQACGKTSPDSVRRRLSWWPHVRHRGEQERATQGDRTCSRGGAPRSESGGHDDQSAEPAALLP
jgi:hypothetical protein